MKKCPKCGSNIPSKAKFCNVCGYNIKTHHNEIIQICLLFIILVLIGIGIAIIANRNFEKKYLQPATYKVGNANATIYVSYDKKLKRTNIQYSDHTIKQWQLDYIKFYNLQNDELIDLDLIYSNKEEIIKPNNINLVVGEPFKASFIKNDTRPQDYVGIKKSFSGKSHIETLPVVNSNIDERQTAKKEYFKDKKQREIEEIERQNQIKNMQRYLYYNDWYY